MCVCFEFIPFDVVLLNFFQEATFYSVMPHAMAPSQHLRGSTTATSSRTTPWTSLSETQPCHDDDRVVILFTAIRSTFFFTVVFGPEVLQGFTRLHNPFEKCSIK